LKSNLDIFTTRLYEEWIPDFFDDENRQHKLEGFKSESIKVTEFDANHFMRALDGDLVKDSGGGRYRSLRSKNFQQLFWTGSKLISPRPITLWIEPIITIGVIARLCLDYGWSEELLCMESSDGAFDFVVFKIGNNKNDEIAIAGEVKKTKLEIDTLIKDMVEFGENGVTVFDEKSQKKLNSFRKWKALLKCKAPFFWAVGPDDYTYLFSVKYLNNDKADFIEIKLEKLNMNSQLNI